MSLGNQGAANEIKFYISLPYDNLQFNVLAVDGSKNLKDYIAGNVPISYQDGLVLSEPDETNGGIDGQLDIINYQVRTYEL